MWGLFVRRFMLDDGFYELLSPICELLAAVAVDGFAGFWREEADLLPTVLIVRGGHTYLIEPNGKITRRRAVRHWMRPICGRQARTTGRDPVLD